MRINSRHLISGLTLMISLGCTKGTPDFGLLDQNAIPRPTFAGQTSKTVPVTSDAVTTVINGECDFKISALAAQLIGVASASAVSTLSTVSVTTPTLTCQTNGKFQFELKGLAALGFSALVGQTYEVQLRGVTTAGLSNPSSIFIKYIAPSVDAPRGMVITSGGTESSSGQRQAASTNFKAEIRIDHASPNYTSPSVQEAMAQQSSAHFKAKIGAAARSE